MGRRTLVDREIEVDELRRLADEPGAALILVYGRRRVGKTFLLRNTWEDRRLFYYLAADSTSDQNRMELLRELNLWSGARFPAEDHPSWRTVFRALGRLAEEKPLIVVLDEFQYLLEGEATGVASQLNAVWEGEISERPLTMVLCGSEVATMEGLARGGALYGRFDRVFRLRPFTYLDAARMIPDRPRREQAYAYGIFGGTPQYLDAIRDGQTLGGAVREHFLSPRGEVHLQLDTLIQREEGIREPGLYRAVLAAVAAGGTRLNEIVQAAGIQPDDAGRESVRRALDTLIRLEYVTRERNFAAGRTTAWRHHLADNAVKFWYRYVHPNRSALEIGADREVWEERIRPDLDPYMGWEVFEGVAAEAYRIHRERWGLSAPEQWSRWVGKDRERRDIEIDIVARLVSGKLLTGEIKWSSRPVGPALHRDLISDLHDLAASGRGWARRALDPDESEGHLYVSAAGFTDTFRTLANDDPRIHLASLEDLYA